MSLLGADYASSEDESPSRSNVLPKAAATKIVAAPEVTLDVWSYVFKSVVFQANILQDPMHRQIALANPTGTALTYNVRHEYLSRPLQGPANPFKLAQPEGMKRKNVLTGYASEAAISDSTFKTQHLTFQNRGFAQEPNANGNFVGDLESFNRFDGQNIVQSRPTGMKRKREPRGDPSIMEGDRQYRGPWARPTNEALYDERDAAEGEELASDEEYVEEESIPDISAPMNKASTAYENDLTNTESTQYDGSQEADYMGRSYMMHPPNKPTEVERCYYPKKLVNTWKHGSKPITAIRFFPKTAHLLLSASADAKIKIFDVYREQELLRTYSGHVKALTDAEFSPNGSQMLSAALDRYMKLWDVETGTCLSRFKTGAIPHVIKFNPSAPHEFVAGMSDKKIVQFDTRVPPDSENSLVQEYDHHLGPINSITFVDEDRRFISTSDDKSLRAWEVNIPVPIKFIAEPYMYALTRAALHPSGKHAVFQSGDNQIVVYAAGDRFRQNRKKLFRGHNTSGYAVDVDISPDGGLVTSGDSAGYVCFWDWKTCKMYEKIKASAEGAITCVRWNPQTTSRVATAGTEGIIKYWD
ncbi:uncharacterized protein KY384_001979 [Bacidia gigantensis]|uniref:uncharacterized protein n=1 Tax=Bacidia gigantensis TaxID=2732470 RepID=UPI001D042E17|nr:uncharacterized protein KY384_001979 [Bacidia gigantensis]KAG8533196.1 hypothetical protein KY384_001979 [Bacidia gigantensis]